MKNSKLGAKNVIWGILAQIITISVGIIIPRLVLVNLGSESNGLLNSVGSVLTYLSLLEAGVGTATIQALYQPVANNDRASINSILSATHYFYRRTGFIYLAIVLVLSSVYSWGIQTTIPRLYVFLVVIMSGLSGVISYFFQGKYRLLLAVEGKSYIVTNTATLARVGISISKALVLMAGGNVVMVQSVYFVFNLAQMVFIVSYMHKHYKWIDLKAEPCFEAISQRNAVLVHQIATLVFYNTDNIILTAMSSLKAVSVYSMYAMVFGMVKSIAVTLSDSFVFALGQAFSDKKRFLKMFDAYEVYNISMTFSLFCTTGILILPFIQLYTAGITDTNYVDKYIAGLFLAYYLMDNGRKPSGVLINIAQHFEKTKWRALAEMFINLISSVILTWKLGIYGVLLGTVIALLYRANDMILYSAGLLERSPWITYLRWGRNVVLCVAFLLGASLLNIQINGYLEFLKWGAIISFIVIPTFLLMNSLFEPESARYTFQVVRNMLRREKN